MTLTLFYFYLMFYVIKIRKYQNSPGCLKCECDSNEVFPTLTVVSEFAVYPVKDTKIFF